MWLMSGFSDSVLTSSAPRRQKKRNLEDRGDGKGRRMSLLTPLAGNIPARSVAWLERGAAISLEKAWFPQQSCVPRCPGQHCSFSPPVCRKPRGAGPFSGGFQENPDVVWGSSYRCSWNRAPKETQSSLQIHRQRAERHHAKS